MSKRKEQSSSIKQIIFSIFFIIAVAIGIITGDINVGSLASGSGDHNSSITSYELENIPEYSGEPYTIINENKPNFKGEDFLTDTFESYSELDELGRCGVAFANLGKETMPAEGETRKSISNIKPTGWHNVKYDNINGKNLYNRCHLIAYCLSAENDNEKNLITGTRYFNVDGMLTFEKEVLEYLRNNENNHVLYRVTPIFEGENLVASGVTIEIASVEDRGEKLEFYVYVYNVQPGITIDYATGDSSMS